VHLHEAVTPPARKKTAIAATDVMPLAASAVRSAGVAGTGGLAHELLECLLRWTPSRELAALYEFLIAGCGINLYLCL
jgi:hypothetical protein